MAHLFNRIGQVGLGVALVGGVVNSALYNGKIKHLFFQGSRKGQKQSFNYKKENYCHLL